MQETIANEHFAEIIKAAENNFANLTLKKDIKTPHAKFYRYPQEGNIKVFIKVFDEANDNMFWVEFKALHMLKTTGRVCPIICATTDLYNSSERGFKGPYFIAKPYYNKFLDDALKTKVSDLDKLDIAAQLVDLAQEFRKCRYYDYDWRKENDAIDENGRVVRIDLDATRHLNDLLIEKWTARDLSFFTVNNSQNLMNGYKDQEVFQNKLLASEVSNMAVRLSSNIFFDRESGELASLVSALQKETTNIDDRLAKSNENEDPSMFSQTNTDTETFIKSKYYSLKNFFRKLIHGNGNSGDETNLYLLDEWIVKWEDKYKAASSEDSYFKDFEHQILARLFYYLIANPQHGFNLNDLHTSLVILLIDFLRLRIPGNNRLTEPETIKILSPQTGFFEITRVLQINPNFGSSDLSDNDLADVKTKIVDQSPEIVKVKYNVGNGQWAAYKKGNQECQDFAFSYKEDNFAFVLVADGVTGASGLEAKKSIDDEVTRWIEEIKKTKVDSISGAVNLIKEISKRIHKALQKKFEESNKRHEAHLVMAFVYQSNEGYCVSIGQAGNDSKGMIYAPEGNVFASTNGWMSCPIGAEAYSGEPITIETYLLRIPETDGMYRLRLYSDGAGDVGSAIIRETADIGELVNEAGKWSETIPDNIGEDDWSIAGIDIIFDGVSSQIPIKKPSKNIVEQHVNKDTRRNSFFSLIKDLPVQKFNLSISAQQFWRTTLTEINEEFDNVNLSLIQQVVKYQKDSSPQQATAKTTPPVSQISSRLPELDSRHFFGIIIIALFLVSLFFYYKIYNMVWERDNASNRREQTVTIGSNSSTSPTTSPSPSFSIENQKNIFNTLYGKKIFVENGLPGGQGIEPPISEFLKDLAEVVQKSKFRVKIEVFSTPAGKKEMNLKTTQARALAIKKHLTEQLRLPASLVEVVGRGGLKDTTLSEEEKNSL